jgi:hypothetical protein
MDSLTSKEEEALLKSHGWYSHLILPEYVGQKWVNYHTHGLPEHYGHLDFQIVLPVDGDTLHKLATRLVDRVKQGERFASGMHVSGIIEDYDVLLVKMTETQNTQHPVLRVILPDKDGNLDKTGLTGIFAAQFQELLD